MQQLTGISGPRGLSGQGKAGRSWSDDGPELTASEVSALAVCLMQRAAPHRIVNALTFAAKMIRKVLFTSFSKIHEGRKISACVTQVLRAARGKQEPDRRAGSGADRAA